jgi:hypothetical protein
MKWPVSILSLITCTVLFASGKTPVFFEKESKAFNDTLKSKVTLASFVSNNDPVMNSSWTLDDLSSVLRQRTVTQFLLGHSQDGRKIDAWYIPGISDQKALVIAGVHGSELSSVEVAYSLLSQLLQGKRPYYSVIIVPSLFPDNAIKAMNDPAQIGGTTNIGRYTLPYSVDPNRQMPSPGKAFDETDGVDHLGRQIETENQLLLQLIQKFRPQRIANIHAIRDTDYGGVYADPRTDHKGFALGYESDSNLAIEIARYIDDRGGNVAGNHLDTKPSSLYYKDPAPMPRGVWQKRNMTGSALNAKRGSGVSLGTWASTAVIYPEDPSKNRDAMRIITIEYPGYKRPVDYSNETTRISQQKQVELFASAVSTIFLGRYYVENEVNDFVVK